MGSTGDDGVERRQEIGKMLQTLVWLEQKIRQLGNNFGKTATTLGRIWC